MTAWAKVTIGSACATYSGGTPSKAHPEYYGGDIPWIASADLNRGRIRSVKGRITRLGLERSSAKLVKPGTPLIALYGATAGVPAVTYVGGAINQAVLAMVPRSIDAEYLYQWLLANRQQIVDQYTQGGQPNLSGAIVRSIELPLPPAAEQHRISVALRDADDLITALERMIAKKQSIKQGMMQQLLTGKTRLPGYNQTWTTASLGKLGTFLRGHGVKRDDVRRTGVRCIRYGELYTVFHDYTDDAVSFVSSAVAATALPLRTGDLLFAGSGETREEIGKCVAYVGPMPAVAGGDVIVLRGSECNAVYLALLVNTPEIASQKARAGQGDAVVHIYSQTLAALEVKLPPRVEQDAIARVIVDANCEIGLLRQRLAKMRGIKQGMMQQLLAGRIRLPIKEGAA
jgi:type I restriction enzyme, S subunit